MAQIPLSTAPVNLGEEICWEGDEGVFVTDTRTKAEAPTDEEFAVDDDVAPTTTSDQTRRIRCTGFKGNTEAKGLGSVSGTEIGAVLK